MSVLYLLLLKYCCHLFLRVPRFLLRLFNLININPAAPQRIIATIFCCMNHARPPNAAKIIPSIPMACLYFINTICSAPIQLPL